MLLLDSRMLGRGRGALGHSAGQEMGAGALSRTKASGASLPARTPSPAPAWALPLRAVTHAQHPLAGSARRGDASGPASGPLLPVPVPWQTPGSDPGWGQTSLLLWGGLAAMLATSARAPSPHREGLPELAPGLEGGIPLIFLNKREYYFSLRGKMSSLLPACWGCGRRPRG